MRGSNGLHLAYGKLSTTAPVEEKSRAPKLDHFSPPDWCLMKYDASSSRESLPGISSIVDFSNNLDPSIIRKLFLAYYQTILTHPLLERFYIEQER